MTPRHSALRTSVLVCLAIFVVTALTAVTAQKADKSSGRLLFGKVLDQQDNPLPDAVVYLTNSRTRAVKSYIVGPDGAYRFPALSSAIDYEVYAQYKGHKSDAKSVSQFDDRPQVYIDLKITTR